MCVCWGHAGPKDTPKVALGAAARMTFADHFDEQSMAGRASRPGIVADLVRRTLPRLHSLVFCVELRGLEVITEVSHTSVSPSPHFIRLVSNYHSPSPSPSPFPRSSLSCSVCLR